MNALGKRCIYAIGAQGKRSRKTPKGLQALSPGQATKGSGTLGLPKGFMFAP